MRIKYLHYVLKISLLRKLLQNLNGYVKLFAGLCLPIEIYQLIFNILKILSTLSAWIHFYAHFQQLFFQEISHFYTIHIHFNR